MLLQEYQTQLPTLIKVGKIRKSPAELQTRRLILNSFKESDAGEVFSYASNKEICRYTSWHSHRSVEDSINFIKQSLEIQSTNAGRLCIVWAIRKIADTRIIGSFSVTQLSRNEMQIDYALSVDEWGNGYMSEAIQGVSKWIFENFSTIKWIRAKVIPENSRSISLLQKSGFAYTSDYLEHIAKFGSSAVKLSLFSLSRPEH